MKNSLYLRELKANIMTTQVYSHDIELSKLGGAFLCSASSDSNGYDVNKNNRNRDLPLLHRAMLFAVGFIFVLMFASCQDGQFPPVGTYENAEGEYYHFCSDNSFHCKISEIDHLLTGLYEQLGDSTILLTFYDEDGYETGDEVALRFSQCAPDSFYIESVGGTPIHKVKYIKKK